ncbi:hypothetical protein ANN_24616 [Periplaneta americana]|uniref:V-SNARE coiled-coil homology domain-containing protein n=1 Tax=Periplaneta americana TaxID=6978 RepID=A0ABQ8S3U7_PERAM|nr:hypothetical protein ANN_24616 [Periplaneta americana]
MHLDYKHQNPRPMILGENSNALGLQTPEPETSDTSKEQHVNDTENSNAFGPQTPEPKTNDTSREQQCTWTTNTRTRDQIARTFCFSNRGHGLYLCSPTEVQKFTVSAEFCLSLAEMVGELFLPHDMPEPPKESFFKGLFGGGTRSLDREELSPAACEVRSVIKFLNAQGIAPIEIYRQLCQVYGPNVMSKQMVRCCCRQFSAGCQNVHDEERSGRPTIITDDLVEQRTICLLVFNIFHVFELGVLGESSGRASRSVAKLIPGPSANIEAMGQRVTSVTGEIARTHQLVVERGEKLGRLEERAEKMSSEAENFSHSAHNLMLKYKDKKWYQLRAAMPCVMWVSVMSVVSLFGAKDHRSKSKWPP